MSLLKDLPQKALSAPYGEVIEDLVSQHPLVDLLARKELESISTNREETVYVCGDNIIRLVGAKSSDRASVYHTPRVVGEVCGSASPISVHFHGPYLSYQSSADRAAHERLFEDGFQAGCAVGIDGLRCVVPSGHEYEVSWSDDFYEMAARKGVTTMDGVKNVVCRQTGRSGAKECTLKMRDGRGKYSNLFSEQIWEQEGAGRPYVWFSEGAEVPLIEKSAKRGTRCVISETKRPNRSQAVKSHLASLAILGSWGDPGERRRILTCFFREGI